MFDLSLANEAFLTLLIYVFTTLGDDLRAGVVLGVVSRTLLKEEIVKLLILVDLFLISIEIDLALAHPVSFLRLSQH